MAAESTLDTSDFGVPGIDSEDANSPGPEVVEDTTSFPGFTIHPPQPEFKASEQAAPLDPQTDPIAPPATPLRINAGNTLNVPVGLPSPGQGFRQKAVDSLKQGDIGKRRGHKYKHSSVSQFNFLEPPPRAPLAVPASLDVPTASELLRSTTFGQKGRALWSLAHLALAGIVVVFAQGSMAMSALSRLIFFDAISAVVCAVVDVLANFEVWGKSSLKYPFGLRRGEVLAGFTCSIVLIFMGMELAQHSLEHLLEHHHRPLTHVEGEAKGLSAAGLDIICVMVITGTLISALFVRNHARIGRIMRFSSLEGLHPILSNPSHALTLTCSTAILSTGILGLNHIKMIDTALSWAMITTIGTLGILYAKNLGTMLMMGQPDTSAVTRLAQQLEADRGIVMVNETKCWQVDYELGICSIRVIASRDEDPEKVRTRVAGMARSILGTSYGSGSGAKWETTVEVMVEN